LIKNLFILIIVSYSATTLAAKSNDYVLQKGNLLMVAPPVLNKDYFAFEFGFITEKIARGAKYNAFVTIGLFQDSLDQVGKLKAGGLGFKGGIMIPTQPWVPLLFTMTGGFAKTVLHQNPFLGKDQNTVSKKDMLLLAPGLLYKYDNYFLRTLYQVSNVKYFKRHFMISFGVSY
jgi:hypothetical protein